jgi:methylated-DNA-[protein]-cysteine S-methyltransferase
MLSFMLFTTHLGWMGIIGSPQGIRNIILPQINKDDILQRINREYDVNQLEEISHLYENIVQRIQQYLNGKRVEFPDSLDMSGATAFQQSIWETTRTISYGETRSYSWIAHRTGSNAARAVGQALKRNPLPLVIPCHRVIRNDSSLGGFAGGIELKDYLLKMESEPS